MLAALLGEKGQTMKPGILVYGTYNLRYAEEREEAA